MMLSREEWYGCLKEVHTVQGYTSTSRFVALMVQMEVLIQDEVDQRWKAEMEYRCTQLQQVFDEFDWHHTQSLQLQQLLRLGAARPCTKATVWTDARNKELLNEMDKDGDNKIQATEFVGFMNDDLPRRRPDFDALITEFLRIAQLARAEWQAQKLVKESMSQAQLRR